MSVKLYLIKIRNLVLFVMMHGDKRHKGSVTFGDVLSFRFLLL